MTARLIDPDDVAAFKAKRANTPTPSVPTTRLSYWDRITYADLGKSVKSAVLLMGRWYDSNKSDFGGSVLEHGLTTLLTIAKRGFEGAHGEDLRAVYDEARGVAWQNFQATVRDELARVVPEQVAEHTRLLREAADMAYAAADAAHDEARRAERERDELRATVTRLKAEHAAELDKITAARQRDRDQAAARERTLNEERRQLRADLDAASATIHALTTDLERAPQEATMTNPPATALERMSLHVYERQHPDPRVNATAAWRRDVTDHVAFLRAHLVERGLLRRAA